MPLGFPKPIKPDDPRLARQVTTFQASRGGWFKPVPKPVPGTPKTAENDRH